MRQAALAAGLALIFGCASVDVEQTQESRQIQAIVRTTNSPFCPGKTLDSCPSPRAAQWRQDINAWVADGVEEEEIRERLQSRVPSFELRPAPVKTGWVIPLLALLVSTLWLVIVARSFRQPPPPRPSRAPPEDALLDARLDDELARAD
jgi:cytochrome c-type biogenesis protein CcmH/NrfF